jgi:hypothetical protein
MRILLLCATAALFAVGCNNTPAVPPDSRAEAKAETKKNDPPPETKKDSTPATKAEPWGTVRGRVTWDGKELPNLPALTVVADVAHCTSKGAIPDEKWVINKDNKGVKNVFVWLQDASNPQAKLPVHPALKAIKEKDVRADQPCCKFEPHALALREGQVLVVHNSSPVNHNYNYLGGDDNPGNNRVVAAGTELRIDDLKASPKPISVSCGIHPWMKSWVRVFDHPYFAVTDADGKFEIKDAPAGKFNIVLWHEEAGWVSGGKKGKPIEIKAGGVTEVNEGARPAAE